jgi:death-on-curing protein
MIRLTKKQILTLHSQLIQETGGSDGVRDEKLLESALETPFQSFGGEELYPSTQAKGARLCYGLVKNHAMVDGNKRIGAHAMLVFLALNGYELSYTQKELSDAILDVAAGHMSCDELLNWIIEHQK